MVDQISVIAVDGPSGVGKGTIGKRLTSCLGWHFLDSGALYRLTGLAARRHNVSFNDIPAIESLARNLDVEFRADGRVFLENEDVSDQIRTEIAGNDASKVAAILEVRSALLQRQRDFRRAPGLVADGRDMGTTVFPDAQVKVFLTASARVRAERRYKQLKEKGLDVNLANLLSEIAERDERDRNRKVSPLKPADDAIVIDTSELGVDIVFQKVMAVVEDRLKI